MPRLRCGETESEQNTGTLEQVPALGNAERWWAGKGSWLWDMALCFWGEVKAHVEGEGGRMRCLGSSSPKTARLGSGSAGPEMLVPTGLSQLHSSAPFPRDPSCGGASQPGPVPFKPLELLPALA